MMIKLMVNLAKNNRISPSVQEDMQKKKFSPLELIELNEMQRKELMYLMMFCDIRLLNETPVIALDDDELRTAYLLWRAAGQTERKKKRDDVKRKIRKVNRVITRHIERGLLE